MHLSIVTTLYQSSPYIREFYNRIATVAEKITPDYEIIFVNDGSPDNSLEVIIDLHQRDKRVRIIDLSRNFGHHKAIMAGLSFAKGHYVFLLDCDLEEDPELLESFYQTLLEHKEVDVVYGVQPERKGNLIEKKGGEYFYKVFNKLSGLDLVQNPLTVRIMTSRYVHSLLMHKEEELFLAGIFEITGFNQKPQEVTKKSKIATTYTFKKRLQLLIRGLTSFSSLPLFLAFYSGGLISIVAMLYAAYLILRKLIYNDIIVEGWTSLMVSIWFLSGLILLSSGLIGIYISRIYYEVKRRPNFIIRQVYGDD